MDKLAENEKCIVTIKDGPICGYVEKNCEGTFYKFKKIPYAKPPLETLRFMPPVPNEPWTEVLDCTQDAPQPLNYTVGEIFVGSEDCLYIKVSTPNIKPEKPMPVMFWIGSSYFIFNLDNIYDPSLINNQDIVFVRCGFRLGPFGFLSNMEMSAPGNSGLKDIVMALTWVQRNISFFGGDPNNVTIFGGSTGSSMVHLMILSPMATGLFHKAIMQSSSALHHWSQTKNPVPNFIKLAKELNITKTDNTEILEDLKTLDPLEIMNAYLKIWKRDLAYQDGDLFDSMFKPCAEKEFEGQPVFLNKSPALILKSKKFNKVPIMIGSNNIESSFAQYLNKDLFKDFDRFNKNPSLMVPRSHLVDEASANKLGQQLLEFYFEGKVTENDKTQYLQLLSDYQCLYYINTTVKLHCEKAPECPVYYYILNCAGKWTVPANLDAFNSLGHFAEIPFLFKIKSSDRTCYDGCKESLKLRRRVVKMWTNFAKFGNPTPDEDDPDLEITWDPVTSPDKLNYLSINHELTKGRNPFRDRMKLWERLHDEHMFLRTLVYFNDVGVTW